MTDEKKTEVQHDPTNDERRDRAIAFCSAKGSQQCICRWLLQFVREEEPSIAAEARREALRQIARERSAPLRLAVPGFMAWIDDERDAIAAPNAPRPSLPSVEELAAWIDEHMRAYHNERHERAAALLAFLAARPAPAQATTRKTGWMGDVNGPGCDPDVGPDDQNAHTPSPVVAPVQVATEWREPMRADEGRWYCTYNPDGDRLSLQGPVCGARPVVVVDGTSGRCYARCAAHDPRPKPAPAPQNAKPLPVPWEEVWVSSSDGIWSLDEVEEEPDMEPGHFRTGCHGIMTESSRDILWKPFDKYSTMNERVYKPIKPIPKPAPAPVEPAPGTEVRGPVPVRHCNRHEDCDAADAKAKSAGRLGADHCHDSCCSDCFGD